MSDNEKPRETCEHGRVLCGECEAAIMDTSDEPRQRPRLHTDECRFWRNSSCDCGATAFNQEGA